MKIKSKKFLIIIFSCFITITCIFLISSICLNIKIDEKDFHQTIKNITKNTKLIYANTDDNQALDVADYAKSNNIKIPSILINFDTHSDIYLNHPVMIYGQAGVESWINELVAKNPQLKEVYWVMPIEEARNPILQTLFAENDLHLLKDSTPLYGNCVDKDFNLLHFLFSPIYLKAFSQELWIEPKTGLMNEYIKGNTYSNMLIEKEKTYKSVKVITCTRNTLPNFKNKPVFLSIDADYTSNSGFDTIIDFKIKKSQNRIYNTFYYIFKTIEEKQINPEIISLSLSPQYLPKKHHKYVLKIFENIIKTSGKQDLINKYTRKYTDEDPATLRNSKKWERPY